MREFMTVAKALADETRVRLLMALEEGELCVCQLIELVGLAPSTVSKHLTLLRQVGLIDSRKEGRWVFYRLADRERPVAARRALDWARECLADDATIEEDRERLRAILPLAPEELCRKQCGR